MPDASWLPWSSDSETGAGLMLFIMHIMSIASGARRGVRLPSEDASGAGRGVRALKAPLAFTTALPWLCYYFI